MGRRILFVGMQSSIHVARWIELVADHGWELHFFPIDEQAPNPNLRGVTLHWPVLDPELRRTRQDFRQTFLHFARRSARIARLALGDPVEAWRRLQARLRITGAQFLHPGAIGVLNSLAAGISASEPASTNAGNTEDTLRWSRFTPTLGQLGGAAMLNEGVVRLGESDCVAPVLHGPSILAECVRGLRPDLIHSMEFQHCGYLVLRARELYGPGFPTWLATNWGSDIFYFGRFRTHRAQIKRLLSAIDFYSCECKRDVDIARQFGYTGPVLYGVPNSGGLDIAKAASLRSPLLPSRRKTVMIKGYHHFAGRALIALNVVEKFAAQLTGYRIVLFSVSEAPRQRAHELKQAGILDIEVIDWATHEQILKRFGEARLYMGISVSDAISTSVLEAMAMGAFPIQTDTSCCDEWFTDGEGGFIVPPDNFDLICEKFGRALSDDMLVDRAAEVNWRTVQDRLDKTIIAPKIVEFYDQIFAKIGTD
jgi:glycosyltransferase involved in cell wall biosynthesis